MWTALLRSCPMWTLCMPFGAPLCADGRCERCCCGVPSTDAYAEGMMKPYPHESSHACEDGAFCALYCELGVHWVMPSDHALFTQFQAQGGGDV
jgi:hypothetical protein